MSLMMSRPRDDDDVIVIDTGDKDPEIKNVKCDQELQRILDGMRPGRLGISSNRVDRIDELNLWIKRCGLDEEESQLIQGSGLIATALDGEVLQRASSTRFLPEDASHVRESILAQAIVQHVCQNLQADSARVVALFEFVTNYIVILPEDTAETMPLTPYDGLLFGLGTPADRAWAFATLLRQLRLDTVILRPGTSDKQDMWLVGAIVPRSGVLLFDARLGLPIPSADGNPNTPLPRVPATLQDVLSSDAPFRELDLPNAAYPLGREDFEAVGVEIIGTSSGWSKRMADLQFLLPATVTADLFDGLGANQLERIVDAGQGMWAPDDVGIWEHPERQISRIETARGTEGTQLGEMFQIFGGPYVQKVDRVTGRLRQGAIDPPLHEVRLAQLMGDNRTALKDFFPIRSASSNTPSPANFAAAEYAMLWAGISQFEMGKFSAALNTFNRYIAQNSASPGNTLVRTAYNWAVRCHLAENRFLEAVGVLQNAPDSNVSRRSQYLIRRWLSISSDGQHDRLPAESDHSETSPVESTESTLDPTPTDHTEDATDRSSGDAEIDSSESGSISIPTPPTSQIDVSEDGA